MMFRSVAAALLVFDVAIAQNGEMDKFNRKARPMHSDGKTWKIVQSGH